MKRPKVDNRSFTSIGPDTAEDRATVSSERLATPERGEGPSTSNTASARPSRTAALRAPIDAAIKGFIVERLVDDPLASHTEIAAELGVSHDLVGQIARKMVEGETDPADRRLKSLTRQIGKRLSTTDRAMVYEAVIRGTTNAKAAFSQLSALKRVEELEGIVTRKEQREVADNSVPVLPPMFVLKDADVDIGVAIKIRAKKAGR